MIAVLFVQVCMCLYRHAAMQVGLGSGQLASALEVAELSWCFAVLWYIAFLAACVGQIVGFMCDWWRFGAWLPVLGHRRIPGVIGGGLVCSVVAGGAQNIAVP